LIGVATVIAGAFEWDDSKAESNLDKHGVSFYEAALALATDPNEVAVEDSAHPEHVISLVMSPRTRLLYVVSTERAHRTRIIGARKANPHEQRTYAQERP
jgi:uncharacterized DUF497 family protein